MSSVLSFRDEAGDRSDRSRPFAVVVTLCGIAVLLALIPTIDTDAIASLPAVFWLCAALALAGELLPIRAARAGEIE